MTNKYILEENTWKAYLGNEADPKSTIMVRFPDGRRETKIIPSTSQFMVSLERININSYNVHTLWWGQLAEEPAGIITIKY